MKRLLFFPFCWLYFLTSCIGFHRGINSANLFHEIWEPILAELNYSKHDLRGILSEDLLVRHKEEVAAIKTAWQKKLPSIEEKERRRAEREFYFHEMEALNQASLALLEEASSLPTTVSYSHEYLQNIYDAIEQSTTNLALSQYAGSDQIGFCFGRALLIHYLLLKGGIPQENILKIFALDDMMVHQQLWHFHVAVAVRDKDWGFAVIDTLQPKVMPYKEWLLATKKFSLKYPHPRMRFYVADARKFLPASGAYEISWLGKDQLQAYFLDLGQEIQQHWSQKKIASLKRP